jgi:hypothetical protein
LVVISLASDVSEDETAVAFSVSAIAGDGGTAGVVRERVGAVVDAAGVHPVFMETSISSPPIAAASAAQ